MPAMKVLQLYNRAAKIRGRGPLLRCHCT